MSQIDTITAIATGATSAGLGVLRISGPQSKQILHDLFVSSSDTFSDFLPRFMHHGSIFLSFTGKNVEKQRFDEVLVVYFPAPHSYTGEDVVEIHAHGGIALLHRILEEILYMGARQADAGEFTKRAFLNGRIDLSQAEAVAEIIASPSSEGVRLASAKLHGLLGERIQDLRDEMEYLRQRLCLSLDFPEEEGENLANEEFSALTQKLTENIEHLLANYERARPWQEGLLVLLVGKVNAGKSSLMNTLLGRPRAIVTDRAGTTRDYLEEQTNIAGLPIRLVDTAGLRPEILFGTMPDLIDNIGSIERTNSIASIDNIDTIDNIDNIDNIDTSNSLSYASLFDLSNPINSISLLDLTSYASYTNYTSPFEVASYTTSHASHASHASYANYANYASYAKHISHVDSTNIDPIELEGMRRSRSLMVDADLILLVLDGEQLSVHTSEKNLIRAILQEKDSLNLSDPHKKILFLWNKSDIAPISDEYANKLSKILQAPLISVCASAKPQAKPLQAEIFQVKTSQVETSQVENSKNSQNLINTQTKEEMLKNLANAIKAQLIHHESSSDIAPNRRQARLLQQAVEELQGLQNDIGLVPTDIAASRLQIATQYLADITGINSTEETFNTIFADFCIGK